MCKIVSERESSSAEGKLTKMRPRMHTMTMKTCPPLPKVMAYNETKGCGAYKLYSVSKFGVQKRNRMTKGKPTRQEATVDEKMPLAAVRLAFFVSSLM
jgi:hypothetical protein